jgi:hypothetical protein
MRHFTTILSIVFLTAFFACSGSQFSDKKIEEKAVNITEKLDSVNINTFYEWGFGHRGEADIFTRLSENQDSGYYYSCFYVENINSIKLSISRFENFKKDFPCDLQVDSSKYARVELTKFKNSSVLKTI